MYFDTHAHYDDPAFDDDRSLLLPALHKGGIDIIIDPGCSIASSSAARQLSREYDFVYFAAGVHPEELEGLPDDWLHEIDTMAHEEKCVAIGEVGLDYYWRSDNKEEQKKVFRAQLALAADIGKPVIIHDREAHGDCMEMIRTFGYHRGVFHCFSGSAEMAEELLKHGWYLGFDGPVTYKNARKVLEVLQITPCDRILIETDSPYLSPVPMRGKRNDSSNLRYVTEKIAEVKSMTVEEVAAMTAENAKRLFELS